MENLIFKIENNENKILERRNDGKENFRERKIIKI